MDQISKGQGLLLRSAANVLSPAGKRGALLVLIYHRVLAVHDPLLADEPDASAFAAHLDVLSELFQVVRLSEAAERLAAGHLPARAVSITFDDGYANNVEIAAPLLAQRGMTATFFVATDFLRGGLMWNDVVIEAVRQAPEMLDLGALGLGVHVLADIGARRAAVDQLLGKLKYLGSEERRRIAEAIADRAGARLPDRLMMTEEQVRRLAGMDMEIGAHSCSHPILSSLEPVAARREIAESKQQLEDILSMPISSFAYPNGRPGKDYGRQHVDMVRAAGFAAAVSTAWGCARHPDDAYQIPRVAPWDRTAVRFGARMIRSYVQKRAAVV